MIYKGYTGVTEVDEDSGQLFGTVIGIRDVITFVGNTVDEARKSFEVSIDYYLESCRKSGKKPDQPFSGQFMVRIDPATHERLAMLAALHNLTLNDVIGQALAEFVDSHRSLSDTNPSKLWTSDPAKPNAKRPKRNVKHTAEIDVKNSPGKTG